MAFLETRGPFWAPKIVRQPAEKDRKRDPNFENYPCLQEPSLSAFWRSARRRAVRDLSDAQK